MIIEISKFTYIEIIEIHTEQDWGVKGSGFSCKCYTTNSFKTLAEIESRELMFKAFCTFEGPKHIDFYPREDDKYGQGSITYPHHKEIVLALIKLDELMGKYCREFERELDDK